MKCNNGPYISGVCRAILNKVKRFLTLKRRKSFFLLESETVCFKGFFSKRDNLDRNIRIGFQGQEYYLLHNKSVIFWVK